MLPTIVFGAALDPMNQGYTSTSRLIFNLWNGTVTEEMAGVSPHASLTLP